MPIADFSLQGKVAVVTGASRGIGEAIVRGFVEQGAAVVLCSRKQEGLDPIAASINSAGGKALAIACHAGKPEMIADMFTQVKSEFGRVDILVNNAATNPHFGPLIAFPEAAYDKTMEVNVKGYLMMMQHAARIMVEQGGGSIINVASIAALGAGPMQGIYAASKAAVVSLTKTFAAELATEGVRVNAIAPGLIETKFAKVLIDTPEIYERAMDKTPFKRHGQPSELVGAAVYLASDASSFTTGSVMVCDGGSSI